MLSNEQRKDLRAWIVARMRGNDAVPVHIIRAGAADHFGRDARFFDAVAPAQRGTTAGARLERTRAFCEGLVPIVDLELADLYTGRSVAFSWVGDEILSDAEIRRRGLAPYPTVPLGALKTGIEPTQRGTGIEKTPIARTGTLTKVGLDPGPRMRRRR